MTSSSMGSRHAVKGDSRRSSRRHSTSASVQPNPRRRTGLQATPRQTLLESYPEPGIRAGVDAPAIPTSEPVAAAEPTEWELLMQLDSWNRPGLSVAEFKRLFKGCTCGLVMTARTFDSHECAKVLQPGEENILVDLTV
ncbi:hypothetical protein BJ138DRAFT_1119708 [Hygrophoropsis aurantiaca]|uniref:Uncharacterized protein n=1 Tax=Hygrophoropsis aurantiaca TaxID=72124 RepID=A0ACB7ZSS0_9AGAM|nr:hypothetical protein BJ138DRAFT_1119708 [Hygrophoropsis aurantiaca]